MPLYRFKCEKCGATKRTIRASEEEAAGLVCECGEPMSRDSAAPSTQITETLDNGVMVRKLERLADAEQIFHERAHGKKGVI